MMVFRQLGKVRQGRLGHPDIKRQNRICNHLCMPCGWHACEVITAVYLCVWCYTEVCNYIQISHHLQEIIEGIHALASIVQQGCPSLKAGSHVHEQLLSCKFMLYSNRMQR